MLVCSSTDATKSQQLTSLSDTLKKENVANTHTKAFFVILYHVTLTRIREPVSKKMGIGKTVDALFE